MRIILASQSPRRKKLLQQLGFNFEIIPSTVDENSNESDPVTFVENLAFLKANDISKTNPESLIIGADTIVVKDHQILGKPSSTDHAYELLSKLSGAQHYVYTGVALLSTDSNSKLKKKVNFSVATKVYFKELHQDEIEAYIETGSPMDKAGGYGIQDDWGATFVEKIEGDFYNVVGLPISKLYSELKQHFPELIKNKIISS